ncbi:MAG: DUF4389 domain-containing protein [Acidimicrobiaceae bacterium]|nr:DUF4389 domain-containing protein [Acidimicrobiaceae bacterium]MYG98694.1 DUF4389 domain-containing protein [Acidimicrobiaceae bacterium]
MSYPATITIDRPERMANWRPIGQVILVIPQYVFLHTVMNIAASVTAVYAWFSVLFTGKLPPGVAAFHATYVRYRARTFSYMAFLTDKYPPFDMKPSAQDPGGAGISVSISPRLEGMNRLNVLFRFIVPFAWLTLIGMLGLMIGFASLPAWVWIVELVLGAVLIPGAVFSMVVWVISSVASILGLIAVTLTGRWPDGLFRWSAGWVRVDARLWAYSMLLTDEYPPFSID